MDARAFASPKRLRPRRRGKPAHDEVRVRYGPGSAAHRAVTNGALRCVRGTKEFRSSTLNLPGSYPPPLEVDLCCPCPVQRGGASRGDPEVGQSESWPEGVTL